MVSAVLLQDNVLAAEKPPDAPIHEESGDVFLKKDDFLLDSFEQWKGPQDSGASENDVFVFEESTVAPGASHFPDRTVDLELAASPESECTLASTHKIKNSSSVLTVNQQGSSIQDMMYIPVYFSSSHKSCGSVSAYFQHLHHFRLLFVFSH